MCDCSDKYGDCQLCVCGRGVSGADAEAIAAQLLQNVNTEQAGQQGVNVQIDRGVLDSTVTKVVAARKDEEKKQGLGIFLRKSNATIGSTGSLGEKKGIIKGLSKGVFVDTKSQKADGSKSSGTTQASDVNKTAYQSSDTQSSDVKKSVSKSNVSFTSDVKTTGQSTVEKKNEIRTKAEERRKHEQQYIEHIDEVLVETVTKRAEHAEKANKLHTARVSYEKKAKAMEKEEKQIVSHLSEKKKKAEETKELREQQKREAKERQIRTINRSDGFIDRAEQRDEEFAKKKEAEGEEDRERLKKAAAFTMPSKGGWRQYQWLLSFAGSTLIAAGIIGIVFRCLNVALLKDSAKTAVDNVVTAIVEGTQGMGQSGGWSFGPGGGFGGAKCVPRETGMMPKISESKRKWPIERPPMKFSIPGLHSSDEGEEGDFLFEDDEETYDDGVACGGGRGSGYGLPTNAQGGQGSGYGAFSGKGSRYGSTSNILGGRGSGHRSLSGARGGLGSRHGSSSDVRGGRRSRRGSSSNLRSGRRSRRGSSSDVRGGRGSRNGSSSDVRGGRGSRQGSSSDVRQRGSGQSISSSKRGGLSPSGSESDLKSNKNLQQQQRENITGQQSRKLARLNYEETKTLAEQIRLAEERIQYREAKAKAHAVEARLVAIKEWKKDKHKRMEAIRKSEREEILAVQKALDEAREKAKEEKRLKEEEELRIRREKQANEAIARGHRRAAAKDVFDKRAQKRNASIVERAEAEEKERQAKLSKAAAAPPVDDYLTIYGTILVSIALLAYIFKCIKIETLKAHARVSLQNCLQYLIDSGVLDKAKIALCYAACAACNLFSKIPCPPLPFFNKNKSDDDCEDDDGDDDDCQSDDTGGSFLSRQPYKCEMSNEENERKTTVTVKPATHISDMSTPPAASVPITPRRSERTEYIEPLVIIKSSDTKLKPEKQKVRKSHAPEDTTK